MADKVQKVVGFELVEDAVKDAEINCQLNRISNCFFIQGDLKRALARPADITKKWGSPDTIVIDPPRAGMHSKVVQKVLQLGPEKIIYVSCNPTTFARDAKELCHTQYELRTVQQVDLFPHTAHIELVALFIRRQR